MNKEEFGLCIRKSRAKEVTLIKLNSDLSLCSLSLLFLIKNTRKYFSDLLIQIWE